jgi:hypothetical protein
MQEGRRGRAFQAGASGRSRPLRIIDDRKTGSSGLKAAHKKAAKQANGAAHERDRDPLGKP